MTEAEKAYERGKGKVFPEDVKKADAKKAAAEKAAKAKKDK